jgi:hypothetical protein
LQNGGKVTQEVFFITATLLSRVKALEAFMIQHFGECKLIESINAFYRYKLPEGTLISKLFGELERNVGTSNSSKSS